MRKSETAARKARSTRNRHNGRINDYKAHIMNRATSTNTLDMGGRRYIVIPSVTTLPNPSGLISDEPMLLMKTQIVRVPEL